MDENYYYILLEKFFRKQTTSDETSQLMEWFSLPDTRGKLAGYYEAKWNDTPVIVDAHIQNSMLANVRSEMKPPKRWLKYSLGSFMKYASIIIIAIICGTGAYFMNVSLNDRNNKEMIVSVDNGQKANVILPDGTHVWLNSASTISYDKSFNDRDRVVALNGEAYFEVAKDTKRPFIVKAQDVSVRAVGTAFDVKAYPDDDLITTTLIEGKVNVSDSKALLQLLPSQKAIFDKNNNAFEKIQVYDAEIAVLWKNNQLAFDSESLEDIAKILERMYNIHMIFDAETIKQIRFSGRIKNNSLESVLQLISLTSPIQYEVRDSVVTLKYNINKKSAFVK